MTLLLVLVGSASIGGLVGREVLKKRNKQIKGYSIIQSVTVFILVFFMGTKIGSDDRILESIQDIGLSAIVVSIATMGGSLLAVHFLRRLLKMNKKGMKVDE